MQQRKVYQRGQTVFERPRGIILKNPPCLALPLKALPHSHLSTSCLSVSASHFLVSPEGDNTLLYTHIQTLCIHTHTLSCGFPVGNQQSAAITPAAFSPPFYVVQSMQKHLLLMRLMRKTGNSQWARRRKKPPHRLRRQVREKRKMANQSGVMTSPSFEQCHVHTALCAVLNKTLTYQGTMDNSVGV